MPARVPEPRGITATPTGRLWGEKHRQHGKESTEPRWSGWAWTWGDSSSFVTRGKADGVASGRGSDLRRREWVIDTCRGLLDCTESQRAASTRVLGPAGVSA